MSLKSLEPWKPGRDLESGDRVLIQASAGTGKTYQTEGLVVRLVAERGIPVEQILVITFTNSATADLKGRVRERMDSVRRALKEEDTGSEDPVVQHLLTEKPSPREELISRLDRALRDFDLAPISTIHSFCQRTLEQLTFAGDVDPGLQVEGEPAALRQQLVADALALLYAEASGEQVKYLREMGWVSADMAQVVKLLTGPERAVVEPPPADLDRAPQLQAMDAADRWLAALDAFKSWLDSDEGKESIQGYKGAVGTKAPDGKKQFPYLSHKPVKVFKQWVRGGCMRSFRREDGKQGQLAYFTLDKVESKRGWNRSGGDLETAFKGYPLAERYTALCELQDGLWAQGLTAFAAGVRESFEALLSRRGLLSYDSMLSLLHDRLQAEGALPEEERLLTRAMRHRYQVAIVDEFQDTDGAQWGILKRVFLTPEHGLYAVGDPKQSIYRFRNANLSVYLEAGSDSTCLRLDKNWRSDEPLVNGLNYLWADRGNFFGVDEIKPDRVDFKWENRIELPPHQGQPRPPVEVRWFDGELLGGDATELPKMPSARAEIARLCALECRALLEGGAQVLDDKTNEKRTLRPGDIAVLARKHAWGHEVRRALQAQGIPALKTSKEGVEASEVFPWVLAWLDAVAAPGVESAARLLALTPLCGWSTARLGRALQDGAGEEDGELCKKDQKAWATLLSDIGTWAHNWPRQGFGRVFDKAMDQYGAIPRILGSVHGERGATDLRHLAELLHMEERRTRIGPRGLAEWLRTLRAGAETSGEDDLALQLESDASAVKIVTIHASKGLQYPVVMVPFEWHPAQKHMGGPVRYSRETGDGSELVMDLNPKGSPANEKALEAYNRETLEEEMRLLYVATTRARHHLVLWAGAVPGAESSGTARLLLSHNADDQVLEFKGVSSKYKADKAAERIQAARDDLEQLCVNSKGAVGWSVCDGSEKEKSERWKPAEDQREPALESRLVPWDEERHLGAVWKMASYSSLTGGKASDADDPTSRKKEQPPEEAGDLAQDEQADPRVEEHSPLEHLKQDAELLKAAVGEKLPGGTRTGDWLHAVFEHLDFDKGGVQALDGEKRDTLVKRLAQRHGVRGKEAQQLALELLPAWLETPLDAPFPSGPGLPSGFNLGQLKRKDRQDELLFDMSLGAGARWRPPTSRKAGDYTGRINPHSVRCVLEDALKRDQPFGGRAWLRDLLGRTREDGKPKRVLPAIAGVLNGFVDLVFRVDGHRGRYFVCDYKSNFLRGWEDLQDWHRGVARQEREAGEQPPRLRRLHYTRPVMAWGMSHSAYHLQALIYTVALHRLLKLRLGQHYDPEVNLGGHLYLYLRGMEGAKKKRPGDVPLGVWADRWPTRTVVGLDAALAGEGPEAVKAAMNQIKAGGAK